MIIIYNMQKVIICNKQLDKYKLHQTFNIMHRQLHNVPTAATNNVQDNGPVSATTGPFYIQ